MVSGVLGACGRVGRGKQHESWTGISHGALLINQKWGERACGD